MPLQKLEETIAENLNELQQEGALKGDEDVIERIEDSKENRAPRYFLEDQQQGFLKMNSNSYLGLHLNEKVIQAEEETSEDLGSGPGAVRFIHGTYRPHVRLEQKLADFHNREDCIIYSSAYSAMCGIIQPLTSDETLIISDELNHNCIINSIRMARPKSKDIFDHLDYQNLENILEKAASKQFDRVMIITDGVFSMRGDYADLNALVDLAHRYDSEFPEGVFTIMDDSHGVGAYGETGRGTTEVTGEDGADILLATMGKALGVNGGYVATSETIVDYLRETSPFYIYSNPITAPEANAAATALDIVNSPEGRTKLDKLRDLTDYFEQGLTDLGHEVITGEHPIVPLMVRDTEETEEMVQYLRSNHILATAIKYPVVPQGDESIRFQLSADHTQNDLDYALQTIDNFSN